MSFYYFHVPEADDVTAEWQRLEALKLSPLLEAGPEGTTLLLLASLGLRTGLALTLAPPDPRLDSLSEAKPALP